jgi:hypothetical protein
LGAYQFNEVFAGWFPQVILVNESGVYEKHGTVLRVQPDGTVTLIETLNAIAKADFQLRRYPFDSQRLTAIFEVLGFDTSEVMLEADSGARGEARGRARERCLGGRGTCRRRRGRKKLEMTRGG